MSGEEKSDKDALGEGGVFSDLRRLGGCGKASTVTRGRGGTRSADRR